MEKTVFAALIGAAFLLPFHTTAQAAANSAEVRDCVRAIALQECTSARRIKSDERHALITALGKIKVACTNGQIEQAHKAAAKLQLAPQQASTD
ncbi:MAG: hypothetical protein OSB76_04465 [Alphaproteobacteria bacterium]|jgi:hypothetical protein|nr:hypothetical protein [Alphaproteobacteria bacterium]